MSAVLAPRDRQVARAIHQLFWRASLANLPMLLLWLGTKPLATMIYHVLIPFEIAYGLQAIITRDFDSVDKYAYAILILAIIYCILWSIGGFAIAKNVESGTNYVQRVVLANYMEKDYEFFTNAHLGSLNSQASQLRHAFNNYSTLINMGISTQVVIVISSIVIIAWQSLVLALVTLFAMAIVLSFTLVSMKWRLKYRHLLSEAHSKSDGALGDVLGHGHTVKSFATEEYEKNRLDHSFTKLSWIQCRSWIASIYPDIGRQFLAAIATLVLLVLTARLYSENSISTAMVVLIQLYVVKLITATGDIAGLIKDYDDFMTSAYQGAKTMLISPTVVDKPETQRLSEDQKWSVRFDNVSFFYSDSSKDHFTIQDLRLEIAEGEKIGLIGYSGSGKTTLTKLLLRFMDVSAGKITVGGTDIRDISQQELRRCIAYVPQEPLLFHRSILENIAYGRPDANPNEIHAAGCTAYVDEFIGELSNGYDTVVGERGVKLSGGQRQRVAIARAILKDAPILVLDEATSALDSHSEQYIQKALWELMQGRTALVIAHRLSTIQKMDRIVVMDKGRIVETGTHSTLLGESESIYAKLWEHQRYTVDSGLELSAT